MAKLDVLEVRIIEHCHYRCIACGAFSNIAKKEEYGVENYRRDLTKLMELFSGVNTFRIYGGEPLLSENLYSYMRLAREILKDAKIEIVTNGSLLPRKDEEFYQLMKKYAIKTVVSYYGDNLEQVDKGIEKLREHDLEVEVIPIRHFYIVQNFVPDNNPALSRKMCVVSIASYLHGGRLYACPYPFSYRHYDKKHGTHYARLEDGIDIHGENVDAEAILRHLNSPVEFCKNCSSEPHYVQWVQGKDGPHDWFATESNPHLAKDYTWYDFLLEVEKLVYNVLDVDIPNRIIAYKLASEAELACGLKLYIWIDDAYAKLIFTRTFLKTALKQGLTYELIKDSSDTEPTEYYLQKLNAQQENYRIIFFTVDAKRKIKMIKEITSIIKGY